MDATLIIVAVVIIAILVVAVWWYSMRQRSAKLQEKFGSEYQRTVAEKGGTRGRPERGHTGAASKWEAALAIGRCFPCTS